MWADEARMTVAAQAVAPHAPAAFLATLVALPVVVGGLWWVMRRYGVPYLQRQLPPDARFAMYLADAFAIVIVATAICGSIVGRTTWYFRF
jgi:hypothetical protein